MIANLNSKSPAGTLIFTTGLDNTLTGTGTYLGGVKSGTHASGRWTLEFWCRINGVARWMSFPKTYTDPAELPKTRRDLAMSMLRHAKRDVADLTEDVANGEEWAVAALAEETDRVQSLEAELAAYDN